MQNKINTKFYHEEMSILNIDKEALNIVLKNNPDISLYKNKINENILFCYEENKKSFFTNIFFYLDISKHINNFEDISEFSLLTNILLEELKEDYYLRDILENGGFMNLHILPFNDFENLNNFSVMLVFSLKIRNYKLINLIKYMTNRNYIFCSCSKAKREFSSDLEKQKLNLLNLIKKNQMFYISNRIQSYHSTNGMAKEATTGLYKYMVLNNLLNITSQFENFIKKYNILKYTLTNIDITSIYTSVKYSDIKCYLENYLNAMQKKKKFIINEDSNYNISYAEAFATETPNLYAAKSFNCSDFKGLNYTELSILSKYTYIDYYKFSRRSIGAYESLIKAFDNKTLIFGIGDITKVDDIEYFYHAFQKNILKMKMTKKDLNLLKVNEHINFQNSLKINRDKDNYTIYILSKNKSKFLKNYEKNINTLTENEYENFKNLIKCKLVNGDTIILGNKNEIFNNSRMFSEIILL